MLEEIVDSVTTPSNSTTINEETNVGLDDFEITENQNQNQAEPQSTAGKESTAHEINKKDVSKQAEQSPIPYVVAVIAVLAILIYGYSRRKDE